VIDHHVIAVEASRNIEEDPKGDVNSSTIGPSPYPPTVERKKLGNNLIFLGTTKTQLQENEAMFTWEPCPFLPDGYDPRAPSSIFSGDVLFVLGTTSSAPDGASSPNSSIQEYSLTNENNDHHPTPRFVGSFFFVYYRLG
jgi:hypothetical protein